MSCISKSELIEYLNQFITEERKRQFHEVLKQRTKHFAVGLENIYQPHNSNAVIRTCDCFGIQDCYVFETATEFKVSKTVSQGATKWVNIQKFTSLGKGLKELKDKDYRIIATSPHSNDMSIENIDINSKAVIFFGAEKEGLSQELLQQADAFLKIPMYGFTESLNISVSAAIVFQRLSSRLRQEATFNWHLSQNEYEDIYFDWACKSIKNVDILLRNYKKG